jgi:hypothetical protein
MCCHGRAQRPEGIVARHSTRCAGRSGETGCNCRPGLIERARKAWRTAGLQPIGLHECRHTYADFKITAGVNARALHLHGPLDDHDDPRSLRAPDAGQRG